MSLYPVFLKLEGHKVLIVGGGLIAEQKVEAVLRSATDVTVVSPQITPRIRLWAHQGRLKYVAREFQPGMTRGYFLVIACHGFRSNEPGRLSGSPRVRRPGQCR